MIHPLAFVDFDCKIGSGTQVWQFASVIRGATIGRDCTIGACCILDAAILGDGCAVGAGAQLHPGTWLGSNVFFGPGAFALNDLWPTVDKDGFELPTDGKFTVVVEDGASIGAGAVILPGVRIGKGAMVAAGAVVESDIPAGCVYRRNGYTSPQRPPDWRERRMAWVS
jgi:acetyltransferase-like isoleucine patch superfamily enzyme